MSPFCSMNHYSGVSAVGDVYGHLEMTNGLTAETVESCELHVCEISADSTKMLASSERAAFHVNKGNFI